MYGSRMNYRRQPSFIPAYQQRGALMIMAAGFMLLGVLCLALVVDTGRLYLNKRNLQRVIDVAALEVASRGGQCDDGSALAIAQESLARNGFVLGSTQRLISPVCGEVVVASGVRTLAVGDGLPQGVGLRVEQDTPASLVAGGIMGNTITLAASAVASAKGGPLAMLTLRSSLLNVNITKNSKAQLLSSVFGGLLGGNLNISVGAWNGLIHSDIDIFEYMDQLAINLALTAGDYDSLLSASVTTGELVQAAINVMENQIGTPQVTLNALESIVALDEILQLSAGSSTEFSLGELVSLGPDVDYDGVKARVQLFQMVQAIILLANRHNAINAVIPINVAGTNIDVAIKVIEPPQFAAIGNPMLAASEAYLPVNSSPNRIYVRSAQLRLLLSVSLSSSLSSLVSGLTTAVSNLLSPLVSVVNSLLSLNLKSLLAAILGTHDYLDIQIVPAPFRFDVNLDLASGNARVTDYRCVDNTKSLTVPTNTAAATLRVGKMGSSAADARTQVMSTSSEPVVNPVALVDFGKKSCTSILFLPISCGSRVPFAAGGLGLKADVPVMPSSTTFIFESPVEADLPEIGTQGNFKSLSSQGVINSLSATLAGLDIKAYEPNGSALGTIVMAVGTVIDAVVALLKTAISAVLSPILDPLVTLLVENLGLDLAKTEVSANLSCNPKQGVNLM